MTCALCSGFKDAVNLYRGPVMYNDGKTEKSCGVFCDSKAST